MKEIGSFLRDTRINNGVSLEEAAEDLNISVIQLENIEDGNIRAFKDVFTLRELIKDYGKYLGIKTDDIIDEFNDFMFEHTSKISLDDILEARRLAKEKDESENQKVVSPYTYVKTSKIKLNLLKIKPLIILIATIFILLLVVFIIFKFRSVSDDISSELKGIGMEEIYEFTY